MAVSNLDLLLALVKTDRRLLNLKKIRDALPHDEAQQQLRVDAARANFAEIENSRHNAEQAAKQLRQTIEQYEEEIRSLGGKISIVKNTKEYEIITERQQDLKQQIKAAEDQLLANIEETESLQTAFKEKKKDLAAENSALEKQKVEATAKVVEIKGEQKILIAERNRQLAEFVKGAPDLATLYQQCLQRGRGVAAAKLVAGACAECHRRAPANIAALVAVGKNIERNLCSSCGRILYADESAVLENE